MTYKELQISTFIFASNNITEENQQLIDKIYSNN